MEEKTQQMHIMPTSLPRGLSKFIKADDKTALNIRILVVIAIFSLILICIGTIILLNSYTPTATKISSTPARNTSATMTPTLSLPSNYTKQNSLSFQNKITSYAAGLASDETNFENSLK